MQLDITSHKPDGVKPSQEGGFTLIELAIVIMLFALITLPLISLYNIYERQQRLIITRERIENIAAQIRIFRPSTFSYPCPARLTASPQDADYGIADCTAFTTVALNTCAGGYCRASGSRDTDTPANGLNDDSVLIGAVPFRTIDAINDSMIGLEGATDKWGNKLIYAVSAKNTDFGGARNSFSVGNDFKFGVITALDEFGNNTAGIGMFDLDNADGDNNPLTGTREGDAQFALISTGPTGVGGFTTQGVQGQPCSTTSVDAENCDGDATFRTAIGNYDAAGAGFYDDVALFYRDQAGDLWGYIQNPAGGATAHIRKLTSGRVGVSTGNAAITASLDVNGEIRTPTTLTAEICKTNASLCVPEAYLRNSYTNQFPVPTINTTSDPGKQWTNTCPDNFDGTQQVITSLSNGMVSCAASATIPPPPGGADVDCPPGTYIQGLTTKGCIFCSNGNIYPSAALCN